MKSEVLIYKRMCKKNKSFKKEISKKIKNPIHKQNNHTFHFDIQKLYFFIVEKWTLVHNCHGDYTFVFKK